MDTKSITGAIHGVINVLRQRAKALTEHVTPRTSASGANWGPRPVGEAYLFPGAGRPASFI